jgi:hypothetical protein
MSAQSRGAALFDGRHDLQLPQAEVCTLSPGRPVGAEDIRDLQHGALRGAGLLGRQAVQRADHLTQEVGGHLGIEGGSGKFQARYCDRRQAFCSLGSKHLPDLITPKAT